MPALLVTLSTVKLFCSELNCSMIPFVGMLTVAQPFDVVFSALPEHHDNGVPTFPQFTSMVMFESGDAAVPVRVTALLALSVATM